MCRCCRCWRRWLIYRLRGLSDCKTIKSQHRSDMLRKRQPDGSAWAVLTAFHAHAEPWAWHPAKPNCEVIFLQASPFGSQALVLVTQSRKVGLTASKRNVSNCSVRHHFKAILAEPVTQVASDAIEKRVAAGHDDHALAAQVGLQVATIKWCCKLRLCFVYLAVTPSKRD